MHIIIPLLNKLKLNSSWRARSKSADINTTKYYGHQNSIMRSNLTADFCLLVCWLRSWVTTAKLYSEKLWDKIYLRTHVSPSAMYALGQVQTGPLLVSVHTWLASLHGVLTQLGVSIQSSSSVLPVEAVVFPLAQSTQISEPVAGW